MTNNLPYRDLLPGSAEHKAYIVDALRSGNTEHLRALKGRSGKTIRIVSNWFYYALIMKDHPRQDVVVIHTKDQVDVMTKFFESNK